MLTIIFLVLLLTFVGKLSFWAMRAAWGISKVLLTIVFFPLILICIAFSGVLSLALVLLIIGGLIAFVKSAAA